MHIKSNKIKKRQRNKRSETAKPMCQKLINGCRRHATGGRAVCSLSTRKPPQRLSVSHLIASDKSTSLSRHGVILWNYLDKEPKCAYFTKQTRSLLSGSNKAVSLLWFSLGFLRVRLHPWSLNRLFWLMLCIVVLSPSRKMSIQYLKFGK